MAAHVEKPGIFDAHLHIIDPRFPLVANQGYVPAPFPCERYLEHARRLGITGGAVVSGSFQAFDQGYLKEALARLGRGFVGVTQLPPTVTDAELRRLDRAGVRALRFNLRRGGSAGLADLDRLARRVHATVGWHAELYVDSAALDEVTATLVGLPAVSVDHLGLSRAGLPTLLRLVERGVRVKATGFGRIDMDPVEALQAIHAVDPGALMFGTDLPSTRAPRPFRDADVDLIRDALGDAGARRVLGDNARAFYRLEAGERG
ncbi:MAG: amidohydrolase family protein [Myxococcales bacterium]|nr:amidohydrolase family protein [Myxococcales bacterium]